MAANKPVAPDFPVTWLDDAKLELGARPILKGLIEPGAFVVIYGPPGSGKSFFTADIGQHIATGASWRGRRVAQSLVVYVAAEAGKSIIKRFVAWRDNRQSETSSVPLAILTRGPNLLNMVDVEKLIEQLRALCATVNLPLGLVVFDTLSRSIHGGDENKAEDMTMVVATADRIRDEFGAATAYVHHSGKDVTRGARGHSALNAAADLVIVVEDHVATVEKVRDGVAGERFPFTLQTIEVGVDADGEPVSTCLLNASEQAPPKKSAPLKGRTAIGMKTLKEALQECGQPMPGSSTIPKGVQACTLTQWRERFGLRYGNDDKTPARQAFYKARESLIDVGLISISDPFVWLNSVSAP